LWSLLLAAPLATAADAPPVAETPPVATVNGEVITSAELQVMSGSILSKSRPTRRSDIDDAQIQAREQLIANVAQAQAALKLGLDKDPGVAGVIAYQRAGTLARAYQREMFRRNPVTDAMVADEFKRALIDGKAYEFHLAHILVTQRNRAEEIIDLLKNGDKFADLAKIYSVDPNAPKTGGDMGWMRIDLLDEYTFVDAVKALKPGKFTEIPVKGESGWHVLTLLEPSRAIAATPPFDEIPQALREKIKERASLRELNRLETEAIAAATITRAPDIRVFGPAPAVATPGAARP
jgi:peptidyl-prolyl cis-trans isomerase C